MLRSTLCLILIMCGSLQAQKIGVNRPSVPDQRAASAVKELSKNIRNAKKLLVGVENRNVRKKLEDLLSKAEGNLAVVQADMYVPKSDLTDAMNQRAFSSLMKDVKGQKFSSKKAKYLVNRFNRIGNKERLSSRQMTQLIEEIDFDKDRITAVVGLFNYLADKQNIPDVVEALSFEASRKKVRKELGIKK